MYYNCCLLLLYKKQLKIIICVVTSKFTIQRLTYINQGIEKESNSTPDFKTSVTVQRDASKQQGFLSPFCNFEHATSILLFRNNASRRELFT